MCRQFYSCVEHKNVIYCSGGERGTPACVMDYQALRKAVRGGAKRHVRGDLTHPPNLPGNFYLGREWQRRLT
ncbi:hypothetical protein E2C01_041103 [Portunus trituberculatus]|uniref:Uncharacterized protein n=1 Tax=Portunus trituberculatus TaxID=210409 RepID=A0A5B7FQ15_PORTR|nr:hypothetical protein [Portunus trituberculatus]